MFVRGPRTITSGLILYLDANNTKSFLSGATNWYDLSSSQNTCVLSGQVQYESGHMMFSGDTDYVFVGTSASTYNNLNQITLESWCYPMRSSSYEYLFSNDRDCCGVYNGYSLRIQNGMPNFQIWNSATSASTSVASSSSVSLNNWYHICATYDMNQLKIYVNGVLMGITNSTLGIGTPSSFDLKIGAMGLSSIYEYQGYIDVSKIYNRALSLSEVQQNYNALKSRFGH